MFRRLHDTGNTNYYLLGENFLLLFYLIKSIRFSWFLNIGYKPEISRKPDTSYKDPSPSFDDILTREIHATKGQTLLLPCTVRNLRRKVVSWIRSKDLHILTSGRHTFSGDSRFEAVHSDDDAGVDFWGLRIRGAYLTDTGRYECQVNTEPKMSLAIWLTVNEDYPSKISDSKWIGRSTIQGPRLVHVQVGSPVTLSCEISALSQQSSVLLAARPTVRWLHDDEEVITELETDNVSVHAEYSETDQRILSEIHLARVGWEDSGQYTCMQPSSKPDSVKLVVVEGEHSEAMQRDFPIQSSGSTLTNFARIITLALVFLSTNFL